MEPPPAGEGVDRLHDPSARRLDLRLHGLQVVGVEDGQGCPRPVGRIGVEPAVQPLVEGGVGRAIVDEGPAEGLAVEGLGLRQRCRGQFEIVQLSVFTHG